MEMSEEAEVSQVDQLLQEPNFAVICSFFNKFSTALVLKPLSFDKLQAILTYDRHGRLERELIDLHVKLLKKIGHKSANAEKWENYLLKFCSTEPSLVGEYFQLERFGYNHTSVVTKLKVLKCLCDRQFDWNLKFREEISELKSADLRVLPVGVDRNGLAYWCQLDADFNLRLYGGEQDDESGATWTLRAKSRDELHSLIEELQIGNGVEKPTEPIAEVKVEEIKTESTAVVDPIDSKEELKPPVPIAVGKKGRFVDTFQGGIAAPLVSVVEEKKSSNSSTASSVVNAESNVKVQPDASRSSEDVKVELDASRSSEEDKVESTSAPPNSHESEDERLARLLSESEVSGRRVLPPRSKRWTLTTPEKKKKPIEMAPIKSETDDSDSTPFHSDVDSDESDYQPLSRFKQNSNGKKRVKKEESSEDEVEHQQKERKVAQTDTLCQMCNLSKNPELLLLCDKCDDAWHTFCLKPVLWFVPDEDWFCPKCQQLMLTEKLQEALKAVDEHLAKKALEEKKSVRVREKRQRSQFTAISATNIIEDSGPRVKRPAVENCQSEEESDRSEDEIERKSESEVEDKNGDKSNSDEDEEEAESHQHRQKHRRNDVDGDYYWPAPLAKTRTRREVKTVDYSFKEFDEMIQEAVLETDKKDYRPVSVRPSGAGRGKDMANILEATGVIQRERELQQQQKAVDNAEVSPVEIVAPVEPPAVVNPTPEVGEKPETNGNQSESESEEEEVRGGKPPTSTLEGGKKSRLSIKHRRKLNDLDVDNMTESDSEEYKATSSEDEEEEELESDWAEGEGVRRSGRNRKRGPTQSDEDFVVSGSGSDWEEEQVGKSSKSKGKKIKKSTASTSKKKKTKKRYADSSSSESDQSNGGGSESHSSGSDSDPEFRPTKKKSKSSRPAPRRHVPPPKRSKSKPKAKRPKKSPVAELDSELSVGGRSLRTRGSKVNYRALLNPDLNVQLSEEEESADEGESEVVAAAAKQQKVQKAKMNVRNFVKTPEEPENQQVAKADSSEEESDDNAESKLKIRPRNQIIQSSSEDEVEQTAAGPSETVVVKSDSNGTKLEAKVDSIQPATTSVDMKVEPSETVVEAKKSNVGQPAVNVKSETIRTTTVVVPTAASIPPITQVSTVTTPVDPLAALHSMVPNCNQIPTAPIRGIPAPVIVGPDRSGFLPYSQVYQPAPSYYGSFPAQPYAQPNFPCPPHSPFTSARPPYIMGPPGYNAAGANLFLPPIAPQQQFHPQMAFGEKFPPSIPLPPQLQSFDNSDSQPNSTRGSTEGTLTDILSYAIRDSE